MKKIFTLMVISFFLSGCFYSDKMENDGLESKYSDDEIFEKKITCSKLDIVTDIKNSWPKFVDSYKINEVFYSKSKNTCIGIVYLIGPTAIEIRLYDILEKNWSTTKFLTLYENCYFGNKQMNQGCIKQQNAFDEEVRKLKEG